MENPSTTIRYHIIIRPTLNIFLKTLLMLQKDTKVGSQNFGYQIWFCTRLIKCPNNQKVHNVLVADDSSDSDSQSSVSAPQQFWLGSLRSGEKSNKNSVYAKMSVDQKDVVFQLDSGAETNTICEQYVNRNSVRPTTRILRAWNGSQVKPIGEATLDILNTKTNELHTAEFVVVPNNYSNLLGLATLGSMNLIHVNKDIFHIASVSEKDITKSHPTVFGDDQGKLPAIVKLSLCESPDKKILPARNLPSGWPRSGWPLSTTLCYKSVTRLNIHTELLLIFHMVGSDIRKVY